MGLATVRGLAGSPGFVSYPDSELREVMPIMEKSGCGCGKTGRKVTERVV